MDCDRLADLGGIRIVGGEHLKARLRRAGQAFEAMLFGATDTLPRRIEAVYRVGLNEFNGTYALQLTVHHWRAAVESSA